MRYSVTLATLLLPLAFAQNETAPAGNSTAPAGNTTQPGAGGSGTEYAASVLAALNGAGLTGLAGIAQKIAPSPEGQAFFAQLQQGNKTVFAPDNNALQTVSDEVQNNTQLLTQILAYHVLNNTYTSDGIETAPKHTIARTLMRGGNYTLPGNRSQPLVLAKAGNGTEFMIVSSAKNITVAGNATKAANLDIYVINEVIPIPPRIDEAATQLLPELTRALGSANLVAPLVAAQGLTVFAPNDAAFQAAQAQLATLSPENITAILANHVINGTVIYSNGLGAANATSAGGAPFQFVSNDTGSFVTSGNATARIVQSDVIVRNGVVHVIDGILVNGESNPEAAASAQSSAASVAATASNVEPTGPVTATGGGAAGTSAPAGGSSEAAPSTGVALGFSGVTVGLTAVGLVLGLIAL